MVATSHMWPLSTYKVLSVTEELNLTFCLIVVNLSLKITVWLVVTILGNRNLFVYLIVRKPSPTPNKYSG